MWRDLLRRLGVGSADRGVATRQTQHDDVWDRVGRLPRPESDVLVRIEQTALEVYASHGLPTVRGHYSRSPRARSWTFLGDDLVPADRWALMLEHPPERGWRYGTLADIGRSGDPDVQAASSLLTQCAVLRTLLSGPETGDTMQMMEHAVRVGAEFRALEASRAKPTNTPLRLTAPDQASPERAQRKRHGPKRTRAKP